MQRSLRSASALRVLTALSLAAAAAMCSWLVILHIRMVVSSAPQEMREGGTLWLTQLLLEGRNPYALDQLPASADVYGILYYLLVLPFARVFGNRYVVARTISAAAIVASCALLFRLLRRRGTAPDLAFVGVGLFYVSCLYFVGPLARPDAVGVMLSLVSLSVLFVNDVGPPRLLVGLIVAMLALLTKIYLAFPPFVLAAYYVCVGPRRRGLVYGATSVLAAVAVLLAMTWIYPAYLNVAILANSQDASYHASHLISQTGDWLLFSLPLTIALGVAISRRWRRPDLFGFAALANGAAFTLVLGGHPGAHMTYLFQLITPVLLVATFPTASASRWARAAVAAALPLCLVLDAHYFPMSLSRFARSEAVFDDIDRTIRGHLSVLGSTEVAGLITRAGMPVYDSGQSQYFHQAASRLPIPGLVPAAALDRRWDGFVHDLAGGIAEQRFDLIIRNRRNGLIPASPVGDDYVVERTLDLDLVWSGQQWPVDLWRPRRQR